MYVYKHMNLYVIIYNNIKIINIFLGMSLGNVSEWNKLWDLFLNEHEPQEKYKLMLALTASKELWLLTRYVYFYIYNNQSTITNNL